MAENRWARGGAAAADDGVVRHPEPTLESLGGVVSDIAVSRVRSSPLGSPGALGSEAVQRATDVAQRDAFDAQRDRKLTIETVSLLRAAGFARHFVPRRWGGSEGTFSDVFHASVAVAQGCSSAAWCTVLWAAHARFAARLPEAGQKEIWGACPDVRIAAAVMPPAGAASKVAGGWLVQGEWCLASGVDHADWLLLAAPEVDATGRPARVFAVPRSAATIHDTWNGVGLRAAGSNTVVVGTTVVPDEHSAPLTALLAGDGSEGEPRCYSAPAHLAGGLLLCAPALGAARRALTAWAHWARTATLGGARPLDHSSTQERFARSAAEIDMVELMLSEAVRRADTDPVTAELVARNRRDAAMGAECLVAAVDRLFRSGGAHIRDVDGDLHRCWADVLTIASHGALRMEPAAEAHAQSFD